jgi:hypothetical protein
MLISVKIVQRFLRYKLSIVGQSMGLRRLRDGALSPGPEIAVAENSNDNDRLSAARGAPAPDAHGQAAMFLVESLIHALIARSVISVEDAIEIVDAAAEVRIDSAAELGDTPAALEKSLALLSAISTSLSYDRRRS